MSALLETIGDRFHIPFSVIELGKGTIRGTVSETDQARQPSYVFVRPRHVFRTPAPTALRTGMTIKSPYGEKYIVGENGPSDTWRGRLWESFRVFEPSGQYTWKKPVEVLDPITKTKKSDGFGPELGPIYATIESVDRESSDREMREFFEGARFITGHPVEQGDMLDNRQVTKVDKQLGLYIGILL